MKVAIMQPYIFPYIGYFQLINAVDRFIIYDDVNYIKQGWINRNSILVQNKSLLFTIPLQNPSSFSKINETKINEDIFKSWVVKFLKTLEQSYRKAPFYVDVNNLIMTIFDSYHERMSISCLNYNSLVLICNYVGIKTILVKTSSLYQNSNLKGQDRLLDICSKENAKIYVNPIGGLELYNKPDFKNQEIDLFFLKTNSILYKQFSNEFIPWLSIIDVLMFNSKEEVLNLLNQYELV